MPGENLDLELKKLKLRGVSGKGPARHLSGEPPEVKLGKKKRKDSKDKGDRYELHVAKLFSRWSGELIRRTPRSGGWSKSPAFGVAGDLVCDNPLFPFHVECKNREGWYLEDLVTGARRRGELSIVEWWQQTIRECPKRKTPILVFSRNFQQDLAMMNAADFFRLSAFTFGIEFCPVFRHEFDINQVPIVHATVVIFLLADFFARIQPPKGCQNWKTWRPYNHSERFHSSRLELIDEIRARHVRGTVEQAEQTGDS